MKPPLFTYARPESVDEAVAMLAGPLPDTKVLPGGHSLIPLRNLRVARPSHLIDISRLAELQGVHETPDAVTIGAATPLATLERSDLLARTHPLVGAALREVAHSAIRARGTIGGS